MAAAVAHQAHAVEEQVIDVAAVVAAQEMASNRVAPPPKLEWTRVYSSAWLIVFAPDPPSAGG